MIRTELVRHTQNIRRAVLSHIKLRLFVKNYKDDKTLCQSYMKFVHV